MLRKKAQPKAHGMISSLGYWRPLWGEKQYCLERGPCRASGGPVILCFLLWVEITNVCSFCDNSSSCKLMIYTLTYMYNSIKTVSFLKKNLRLIKALEKGRNYFFMQNLGLLDSYIPMSSGENLVLFCQIFSL